MGDVVDYRGFGFIDWHVFLNTADPAKADVIVARTQKLLGVDLQIVSVEPYWKDRSLTDARLRPPLAVASPAEAVFHLLIAVQKITNGLSTTGPQFYDGQRIEMTVLSTEGFSESGIHWLEASTRNFDT